MQLENFTDQKFWDLTADSFQRRLVLELLSRFDPGIEVIHVFLIGFPLL